jgi:acyl carrier protein
MEYESIYEKVKSTLVDALNVDDDQVTPDARLQADLGAESIDFLDIVFRLEREFNIKIPRGELFPESIFQGDPAFVSAGKVTAKGLDELRSKMPFADPAALDRFAADPDLEKMGDLFTVNLIVRYIQSKLAA